MDVTIVDCGIGNIKSVQRMFQAAGATTETINRPEQLTGARRLVIPGVGAFDAGMNALAAGWIDLLRDSAFNSRIPVLGICLGMQLLCRRSEEGQSPGLGWFDADVVRIDTGHANLKLPHMGWSVVTPIAPNPLIPHNQGEQRFYHAHTYRAVCDHSEDILATARYGEQFTTAVRKHNLFGVQFHPEKSHRFGLALIRRFLSLQC